LAQYQLHRLSLRSGSWLPHNEVQDIQCDVFLDLLR